MRRLEKKAAISVFVAMFMTLFALACSGGTAEDAAPAAQPASVDDGRLRVVTTVSPITSIVENIGGTKINLEGIVPEGTNSHTFEPAPSVAKLMSEADLIVLNGLFLEQPSLEMAEANKQADTVILSLADKAVAREDWVFDFSFPQADGHPNPHLWTDPLLGLKYAEIVRDELSRLDSDNADYYAGNYDKFKTRAEDFHTRTEAVFSTVPDGNKKLLTYHDSFPFFSIRYGLEIVGAVQPSDFTEPSAREVADLIDQIRNEKVPAIFGSEVFPSPIMEQIAKEGGAKFIDQLRDDDLPGAPGDPEHTYLGLLASDIRIMATALGGNADSLDGFDTSNVFEGPATAKYPQED